MTPRRALFLLIVGATVLRLVLAAITDLGLDEAYALAVGRQFQLSWFDHPPLVFWIVGAMQALFGLDAPNVLLRLPFVALSAGTTYLLFHLTAAHFGKQAGLWAAILFTAAPFFLLSAGSWIVPDGPLVFFLALAALVLTLIVLDRERRPHWRDWLVAGAAIGLALLSKYHAILFLLGAATYFAFRPSLRFWLARPQPYAALALALVIFLPVVIWNAENGWASFAFQLGRGADFGGSSPAGVLRLFLMEVVYLLPTTALLLLGAIFWGAISRSASAWFFLALSMPIILLLEATRFWTWQSYAHWPMPGWMLLLPVVGAMVVRWQQAWRPAGVAVAAATTLQFAVVVAAVVLLFSTFRLHDPAIEALRVEAGRWTGVAAGLRGSGSLEGDPFIVTTYWRDGARVAEALRDDTPVVVFSADPRGFAWIDQDGLLGRDALIIADRGDIETLLRSYFESFEQIGAFPLEPGSPYTINVVRARNFRAVYPLPYPAP